jgi:tRNA dimethylallyltransferase
MTERRRSILIAGPTASGKSRLALTLAQRLDGVVINADSMQVYRELRVLTARPSVEDEAAAPHRMYGMVAGAEAYSAGRFVEDARRELAAAWAAGKVPIVVGGTGLYFKALLEGLSPIPAVPATIRAHWRGEAERLGAEALHHVLRERDPAMAERLAPTDTQRIVRALEVMESTGQSLRDWQKLSGEPVVRDSEALKYVFALSREELRRRCDARFDAMVAGGAVEEVAALMELQLDPSLPVMRALGVTPLAGYVAGKLTLDEAVERGKAETRQYLKRQTTWLSRNMISWNGIDANETESLIAQSLAFIDS